MAASRPEASAIQALPDGNLLEQQHPGAFSLIQIGT